MTWIIALLCADVELRRRRRGGQVDVGDVRVDDLLGLEDDGELVEPVVRDLDDPDVELEAAVPAGLGMAAGERVEDGGLAAPGKTDDGNLHGVIVRRSGLSVRRAGLSGRRVRLPARRSGLSAR
jgi:hypothetical protein